VSAAKVFSDARLPYVQRVADHGLMAALGDSEAGFARGAAFVQGRVVSGPLACEYAVDHPSLQPILPLHTEAR
jgi:alanine dehydrogenase